MGLNSNKFNQETLFFLILEFPLTRGPLPRCPKNFVLVCLFVTKIFPCKFPIKFPIFCQQILTSNFKNILFKIWSPAPKFLDRSPGKKNFLEMPYQSPSLPDGFNDTFFKSGNWISKNNLTKWIWKIHKIFKKFQNFFGWMKNSKL